MAKLKININSVVKPIKPMHGGGQPPLGGRGLTEYFHYLTEAGVPFSRLHDVGGVFADNRFVDVPNIFRNFDADENDPASYDFVFTDHLITALVDAGVEPYFRLGVTIENNARIKAYRIFPPKDFAKWARICEHIIMHYTEGWADGFNYNIRYWEIWNEPDNLPSDNVNQMWTGTPEQYFELYTVTAKHLKARFPHLKIGGYASCGFYAIAPRKGSTAKPTHQSFIDFFYGFFDYIKAHGAPIDFFSWHTYSDTERTVKMDSWLHAELERLGYSGLETHLNEWDPVHLEFGTAHHSAEVAATMLAMQHGHTDLLCIYDMRTSTAPYCPLFDIRTHTPIHGYYAFVAFNTLYRLGTQIKTDCDTDGLYAVAASDGNRGALMLSNLTGTDLPLDISGVDLTNARYHIIDDTHLLSWAPNAKNIKNNDVILIEW